MTTNESILMEMLARATDPSKKNIDHVAVQMFCILVKSNSNLVTNAHELIVKKLHSNNTTEAIRAIELLEECMSKAGSEFQKRTAKFSFLNELIALVLNRHHGNPAPVETKKRIMECLMLWTVEHQDKSKIQEAYNNLKKQVNFENDSAATNSISPALANAHEQHCTILGKDDKLVAKLLKEGGAENFKKANLLIQKCVNQETRRTESICHFKGELKKVVSTIEVLDEMLNSYSPDPADLESRDIIIELYNTCEDHYGKMAVWPDFLREIDHELLEEVMNTNELLMVVIQRYKEIFEKDQSSISAKNTDLLAELLDNTSNKATNSTKFESPIKNSNSLDELNEIFGGIIDKTEVIAPQHPSNLLSNSNLLQPISVFEAGRSDTPTTATVLSTPMTSETEEKKEKGCKELREIDKLSEEMFKQSFTDQRLLTFKKDIEKLTLNEMAKGKIQTSLKAATERTLKTNKENIKCENLDNTTSSDVKENKKGKVTLSKTEMPDKELKLKDNTEPKNICEGHKSLTLKPLAEISIDLDEVTPLDEGQRLLLDDDIEVNLYFTADRPSEHVSVIVMTVTNKSKLPVKDFLFEASVKKPCKVRLLPPTNVAIAPKKPFRPSTPINQVILLLNPTQKPVDITCIVGYKLGDDPDPIKESIVTKDIPYV